KTAALSFSRVATGTCAHSACGQGGGGPHACDRRPGRLRSQPSVTVASPPIARMGGTSVQLMPPIRLRSIGFQCGIMRALGLGSVSPVMLTVLVTEARHAAHTPSGATY